MCHYFFRLLHLYCKSIDKKVIESIRSNLKTLIPPEFKNVFNIYFFESDTSVDDAALLQEDDEFSYDYRIKFLAKSNGVVTITINRDEFDFGDNFEKITTEAGFDEEEKKFFLGTPINIETTFEKVLRSKKQVDNTIGDFQGTLYFAKLSVNKVDREKFFYKDITGRPDIRDSFGGIRIYRDGFRVRPYGDPKSSSVDWLMLSVRKNKSPAAVSHSTGAWRVNADQMHGSIYISRTNITLPDQANRQGIVETEEFRLLQDFLRNIIRYFEQDRQTVCKKLNDYFEKKHPTAEIEKELDYKIKKDVQNRERAKNTSTDYLPEYIEVKKVSALVDKKDSTIKQLETELQMLRVLATTGIITNTYIHEIKDITHKLGMKITMAKDAIDLDKDMDAAYKYISEANNFRSIFTSWFKVTVESVKRDKRKMRITDVSKLVSELVSSWNSVLMPKNILINCTMDEEISLKCFPYEIESILNNLISNSTAAFETIRTNEKKIDIRIEAINTGIMIEYADNGVGLINAYKENPRLILEPFESDKRSANGEIVGTGMGMWIINRIVNDYGGYIDLSENNKHASGFYSKITLNDKR